MSEIKTVVFSKNRACQLELLLRGMNISATVLYTYDDSFEKGYHKVIEMYPNMYFLKEYNFKEQLLKIISDSDYVMFLADDDIFINPFYEDSPEFKEFKSNRNIVSLSLSLSPKYRYRGLPELNGNKWKWLPYSKRQHGYNLRIWGFPMGLIGNVFRNEDIYTVIEKNELRIPNDLEGVLTRNTPDRPLMMCFDEPKVINNQANQVQKYFPDRNFGVSALELEENFLKGKKLSLDDIRQKAKSARSYHLITGYKYEH